MQHQSWFHSRFPVEDALPGVITLDASCSHESLTSQQEKHLNRRANALASILSKLPNIRKLDLSYLTVSLRFNFTHLFTNLECLKWSGCRSLAISGRHAFRQSPNLTELSLNGYFGNYVNWHQNEFISIYSEEEHSGGWYLWEECPRLERLSFKHATYICSDMAAPEPMTQEMLIKLVRHHPALRWLRSDLLAENVAMLKQERPEITFVTD